MDRARRFAKDADAPILIEGESGTGKTQLARLIHEYSPRRTSSFHDVVLSTLDDTLAGSELFGHVQGAFTDARQTRLGHFASAQGGTLFLDEIGKASIGIQQKLLHAIEYREIRPVGADRRIRVDVRIVAATNIPLSELVLDGRFLPDLEARLDAFRVQVPPLRQRRTDIPGLVQGYIIERAPRCGYAKLPRVSPELMAALEGAPWPKNLRQLSSAVHRLLVDAEGADTLTLDHCLDDLAYLRKGTDTRRPALTPERIAHALTQANGSVSAAARLLGVDRSSIHRVQRRHRARRGDTISKLIGVASAEPQVH
jgi:DNA-binding NtrC family response regulator